MPAPLGRIVRLQVQRGPLKPGPAPRRYDPRPITPVTALAVEPAGARGVLPGGGTVLDVHHAEHPQTRNGDRRGALTFMTTADYDVLRARYGPHVENGIAGESILLEASRPLAGSGFDAGVEVETEAGWLALTDVRAASPCVEFTRFCLGEPPALAVSEAVRRGLLDLDGGARGFRAVPTGPGLIELGARLRRRGCGAAAEPARGGQRTN